jgi:pyruvate dehydrogenase E1 component alpha subunit
MKYSNEEMIKMYRAMVAGRVYADAVERVCMEGKVIGMHHLGQGEEAVSAGIRFALSEGDWFTPTHRMQAGVIYDLDLKKVASEQFGKVTGYHQGMACDFHMSIPEKNIFFTNGIMGQNIPLSTGFAHTLKRAGKNQVMVACEGDGAFSEGVNYEALIFADAYKVPLVVVIVDNGYAISYKSSTYKKNFAERGEAFGLKSVTVNGNDILAVREAMEVAIESARKTNEPCMVELKTLRWGGHFVGGDAQVYRDPQEVKEAKENDDPIKNFEKVLVDMNIMTDELKDKIWAEVDEEVEEAVAYAIAQEYPSPEVVCDSSKVYVNPWEAM